MILIYIMILLLWGSKEKMLMNILVNCVCKGHLFDRKGKFLHTPGHCRTISNTTRMLGVVKKLIHSGPLII